MAKETVKVRGTPKPRDRVGLALVVVVWFRLVVVVVVVGTTTFWFGFGYPSSVVRSLFVFFPGFLASSINKTIL